MRGVLALGAMMILFMPALAQAEAVAAAPSCRTGSSAMMRTELIFGSERATKPPVTDDEWKGFVDGEIAQRFPDGFTLLDGQGEWSGSRGIVRERSHVLIL